MFGMYASNNLEKKTEKTKLMGVAVWGWGQWEQEGLETQPERVCENRVRYFEINHNLHYIYRQQWSAHA